jgi:hypothetical protein
MLAKPTEKSTKIPLPVFLINNDVEAENVDMKALYIQSMHSHEFLEHKSLKQQC